MRIRYWGVRGSIPVPGPATAGVGGNTSCVSLELADGSLIVIDGGTGLRVLGRWLMSNPAFAAGKGRATLLFTHRHWDHIQGVPFFEPAYVRGNLFEVRVPAPGGTLDFPLADNIVALQHNLVNFPVPYDHIRAAYRFQGVGAGEGLAVGSALVQTVRLNHAGMTLGYVITEGESGWGGRRPAATKFAHLCDTAPWDGILLGEGMDNEGEPAEVGPRYRQRVIDAIQGADLVLHDSFFDEAGYVGRQEWGHSTPSQALALCRDAGARRLHLFHYAPDLDDASVARLESETRLAAGAIEVTAAREGPSFVLAPQKGASGS